MSRQAQLEARVRARNRVNTYANQWYTILAEKVRPFVGKKILNVNGGLLKKYADQLPELPYLSPGPHIYSCHTNYQLRWAAKTSEQVVCECHCLYEEESFSVAEMELDVVIKICEPYIRRTDYTAAEVIEKREAYKKAKALSDEAYSALRPFGEFDR